MNYILIINKRDKTAIEIPLKTMKVKQFKSEEYMFYYDIIEAIDIWNNKITFFNTKTKLKRYCIVIINKIEDEITSILDEFLIGE